MKTRDLRIGAKQAASSPAMTGQYLYGTTDTDLGAGTTVTDDMNTGGAGGMTTDTNQGNGTDTDRPPTSCDGVNGGHSALSGDHDPTAARADI